MTESPHGWIDCREHNEWGFLIHKKAIMAHRKIWGHKK